jgi:GntR family transcriptional regulator
LLDGKPDFMVKSTAMSSAASNQSSSSAPGAGSGVAVNASPTFSPLYQQIKALITQSLQSGEWKPGELIPSEVELAARFKVSQGTVRKAIDELSAENLVVRRQGKGTFVATHHEERAHYRFLRLMPDVGDAHQADNRIIEVKRMRAPAEVARLLDVKSGDSVIFIRRVQSFDGVPTILEELWLPGALFRGLTAERLVERVKAVLAEPQVSELLDVAPGTPLLSLERVSFTYGDKPVEVRRGLYRTDRHHYHNELS